MPGDARSGDDIDRGTLNSDGVDRDVSRDQLAEGDAQERGDAGEMLTDDDPESDAAAGLGGGYREDRSTPAIGELGTQGIDEG